VHGNNHPDGSTVACQTLETGEVNAVLEAKGQKNAKKIFAKEFGLIENDMAQPRTDHDSQNGIDKQRIERFVALAFVLIDALCDEKADDEGHNPHHTIVMQCEDIEDVDSFRRIPNKF